MTLVYKQTTGELWLDGEYEGIGYSGRGDGRNNHDLEAVQGVGPIPKGKYRINAPYYSEKTGPISFPLIPIDHKAHGRSGFMIHGDNVAHDASHGCIILGRTIRCRIRDDRETALEVV